MNILIINFEYPPLGGGGGVATQDFARELATRHTVHVITTGHGDLAAECDDQGVHVHRVPVAGRSDLPTSSLLSLITFFPAALWRGIAVCRRLPFDVINAQFIVPSGLPALLLSWIFHKPLVVSLIGGDLYDPTKGISPHRHWWLRALVRFIAARATALTAISQDTKRRAQQLHGVKQDISITPLGVHMPTATPASRQELGLPVGIPVAISIGRLVPRKQYEILLAAWQDVPQAHLLIVGDGPLKTNLVETCAKLGLQDRVHFAGFVSEGKKQQLLRASDIYVSAAEHEGFGIVYLEAMAAGLPIVTTFNGGQIDFLEKQKNALFVSTDSAGEISAAVTALLNDAALRHTMKTNNVQAVQKYTIEKTTSIFEQVLIQAARKAYEYSH
jgi:glycosyltransferase involved in cell wall biosynthesis